jgi:hypothetical protein
MFDQRIEVFLFIRLAYRGTFSYTYFDSGTCPFTNGSANFWAYSESRTDTTYFSLPQNYTQFGSSGQIETKCLTRVHVILGQYMELSVFSLHRVDYSDLGTGCSSSFNVFVHDASEPLPFDIPEIMHDSVIYLGMAFAALSIVGVIVFLWHCWSVKFVLIEKAIQESGLSIRGRKKTHADQI